MGKLAFCLKNIVFDGLNRVQKRRRHVMGKPSEVHLSVTDDCCLQCKMCNIWKLEKKQKPLAYEEAVVIIDKLGEWLGRFNMTFAGGEPFLNPDFIDIIHYAHSKGLWTGVNSNGFVVDEKLAKRIVESGLNQLSFSVDGLEKEHDYVRGRQYTFTHVMNAIDFVKTNCGRQDLKIYINCVLSNNNIHIIDKIVHLAIKKNIDGISFQALMPNFLGTYTPDWYLRNPLWPKKTVLMKQKMNELFLLKRTFPDFILNSENELNQFLSYFSNPYQFQIEKKCYTGLNTMMIDVTGNVRLCYEKDSVGNVYTEDLARLWKGRPAAKMRSDISKCKRPCKLLPCNDMQYKHQLKKLLGLEPR